MPINQKQTQGIIRRNSKKILAGIGVAILSATTYLATQRPDFMSTSMMQILQKSAPFDGTTIPIKEVVDYDKVAYFDVKDKNKSEIAPNLFIPLPKYDPAGMDTSWDILASAANATDLVRRKTVYTVLYLGDYSMSYKEGVGGHPGIDMVVPTGTEVYAIANAVVESAKEGTGAGKHIVLRHDDVPSIADQTKLVIYRSVYEHLSEIIVEKGALVKKGQLIGFTGSTGNSSAPHLHFQIDNENAPWSPYWPTNFQDPSDSGSKTVNPMKWVYKYENWAANNNSQTNTNNDTTGTTTTTATATNINSTNTSSSVTDTQTNVAPINSFQVEFMADKLEANVPVGVKITALDANKQLITAVNFPDSIIFTATNAGTFSPSVLTSTDFKSGIAQIIYTPAETGLAKIKVQAGALVGETEQRTVIETKQIFPDVSVTHPNYQAINFLKQKSIINGYGDGTFQPERFVSRAEMLKIILLAAKKTIDLSKLSNFPDVARSSWYSPYVQSAKDYKVVQGYSDGTFKPDKTVSLAECLKIALETLQVSMSVPTTNPYPDVLIDEWFSKYATYAKEHNLLDKELFEGAKEMKRADVAEIIYRLLK